MERRKHGAKRGAAGDPDGAPPRKRIQRPLRFGCPDEIRDIVDMLAQWAKEDAPQEHEHATKAIDTLEPAARVVHHPSRAELKRQPRAYEIAGEDSYYYRHWDGELPPAMPDVRTLVCEVEGGGGHGYEGQHRAARTIQALPQVFPNARTVFLGFEHWAPKGLTGDVLRPLRDLGLEHFQMYSICTTGYPRQTTILPELTKWVLRGPPSPAAPTKAFRVFSLKDAEGTVHPPMAMGAHKLKEYPFLWASIEEHGSDVVDLEPFGFGPDEVAAFMRFAETFSVRAATFLQERVDICNMLDVFGAAGDRARLLVPDVLRSARWILSEQEFVSDLLGIEIE